MFLVRVAVRPAAVSLILMLVFRLALSANRVLPNTIVLAAAAAARALWASGAVMVTVPVQAVRHSRLVVRTPFATVTSRGSWTGSAGLTLHLPEHASAGPPAPLPAGLPPSPPGSPPRPTAPASSSTPGAVSRLEEASV